MHDCKYPLQQSTGYHTLIGLGCWNNPVKRLLADLGLGIVPPPLGKTPPGSTGLDDEGCMPPNSLPKRASMLFLPF